MQIVAEQLFLVRSCSESFSFSIYDPILGGFSPSPKMLQCYGDVVLGTSDERFWTHQVGYHGYLFSR